ncbi:glycoprotein endo-alpha-1,2-mannosidase-like [Takifugu rubripes]|uniref:glycoprotein endo-alpha-1,2-mannosidase-like n=1 Tax=Takifugu rubripes TaxID=31033 RepID=UPI001145245F|nr:glycoprotein endo-alpha-1,2-mannosidase-like [Takifugu rubripes]
MSCCWCRVHFPEDEYILDRDAENSGRSTASDTVLVLSWYPPGLAEDNREISEDLVSSILDAAYRHNLKVNLRCRSTLSGWNSKQIACH